MKLQLKNATQPTEIQLSDAAFGRDYNETLIHQVVTAYMAAGRAGTKRQKSRAEGYGSGPRRFDPQSHLGRRRPRVRRAPA